MTYEIHKSPEWYLDVADNWGIIIDLPTFTDSDEYDSRLMQKTARLLKEATGFRNQETQCLPARQSRRGYHQSEPANG